ncbi:MAG TPA: DUF1206 domain-containing protein [Mycobacteriales bacterium]|nr:DUF1206 domain-containing protein [Mycobacteriales bacterium]
MPATATRRRSSATKPERVVAGAARVGLVARGCFYLLLAGLVVNLAATGGSGPQADANGALTTIASTPMGIAVISAVALGFFAFGVTRLWGAWRDDQPSAWRRVSTGCQGAFYVALTWIPISYAVGKKSSGSNKAQHRTAGDLLALPGGREIVIVLGVVVIGICANQIRTALTSEYADGMQLRGAPTWVKTLVRAAAIVGIPARALVFVPIGVCLLVAAAQSDPSHAKGLDQLLGALAGRWWGVLLLVVVACGLLVFATYSFLEARYRKVLRAL